MLIQRALFCLIIAYCMSLSAGSGQFQLRIMLYRNLRGELADGSSCRDTSVVATCSVYFKVCLREHQARPIPDAPCTFGNFSNEPRPADLALDFTQSDDNSRLDIAFDFAWIVSAIVTAKNE
jgi:hypothetical protein